MAQRRTGTGWRRGGGAWRFLAERLTISRMANETVVCTYRVRPDAEERFADLLRTHWRTLHGLGFVTGEPPLVLRGTDGGLTYVEIFTWVEGGFGLAHEHPGRADDLGGDGSAA